MESKAKAFGHAIHPIMIVFPLGLLSTAAIFDVLYLITVNTTFSIVSFWMIVAGLIGGLVAALFGFIDFLGIPSGTRAKRIGIYHAVVNVIAMILFAMSVLLRWDRPDAPETLAFVCSFAGFLISQLGGWFGGELVERLGVGVSPEANLNAPNSLTHGKVFEMDVRQQDLRSTAQGR
ncbi:MAG: DUF2231 domain-containing protein [Acidobacteria bacterium]|nr:DUF2231 domain-containing protein [Acidobacteriota bacterium]